MLLSVISLAENGRLLESQISPDPELLGLFRQYFEVTRACNDRCTPENPFFFLRGEGFWHLHPSAESAAERLEAMTGPGSWSNIVANVAFASLDEDLFELLTSDSARTALRDVLIDTYVPGSRTAILTITASEQQIGDARRSWEEPPPDAEEEAPARSTAFARTVRQAYDYQCAFCGVRFVMNDDTVIDAAHLIPWNISHDDRPQNGMALCKNDHWIMDRHIIAPGPDRKWHVSRLLDERIQGQDKVLAHVGKPILLPSREQFHPSPAALEWRLEKLREQESRAGELG